VLEAMEDGNRGEAGLIAKEFVAPGEIKDFKATVNSFRALGMEARHGTTTTGIPDHIKWTVGSLMIDKSRFA
jgi:hypothetical protein